MLTDNSSRLDVRLEEAQGASGIDFVAELCERYDLAKLAYLKIAPSRSKALSAVHGVCRYPVKTAKTELTRTRYRISCFIQGPFPILVRVRRSPLYRNTDGTWPTLPGGHRITGGKTKGPPPQKAWLRLEAVTILADAAEAVVWICAHELYHFLRATRQVPGRNDEIHADRFADAALEEFRGPVAVQQEMDRQEINRQEVDRGSYGRWEARAAPPG